jgi:hypothetical protein
MSVRDRFVRFVFPSCLAFLVAGGVAFLTYFLAGFISGLGVLFMLFGSLSAVVTLAARIVEAISEKRSLRTATFCVGVIAFAAFWLIFGLYEETRTLEPPGTVWLWRMHFARMTLATGCAVAAIEVSRNTFTAIVFILLSLFFVLLAFQ